MWKMNANKFMNQWGGHAFFAGKENDLAAEKHSMQIYIVNLQRP